MLMIIIFHYNSFRLKNFLLFYSLKEDYLNDNLTAVCYGFYVQSAMTSTTKCDTYQSGISTLN